MLPKKNRLILSRYTDYPKGKKRISTSGFELIAQSRKGVLKTAIVVSKKTAKKAVERNRIKRLISERIRKNLDNIKFEGKLAIIVKENIASLKQAQIEEKIVKLINKL